MRAPAWWRQEAERMAKNIFFAIVLLGFAWAWEPTRVRMIIAAKPALELMGPFGEKAMMPIERYSTRTELSFIADQITLSRTEGREVPDARSFQRWMKERVVTKNQGKDPWNQPYYLVRVGSMLTLGSIGEDGEQGTDDDIRKSLPF
jgi:hypothetical protein